MMALLVLVKATPIRIVVYGVDAGASSKGAVMVASKHCRLVDLRAPYSSWAID